MTFDIEELEVAASKSNQIAWELGRIATAMEKLESGALSMEALITLIKLNCPGRDISKDDIRRVIAGMGRLKRFIKVDKS